MKKLLLIFFALISLNAFSQIQVKEGSFKKIDGYVMMDKSEHTDINNKPMALIKITAEGMKAEERARLVYKGNMATYFDVHQKGYETYLYLTAQAATFLKIIHPDYGKTEYWFPEDLCGFCGYEMVVQFEGNPNEQNYLIIKTDQVNANIYIDNEYAGKQFAHKQLKVGSSHTWKIECDLFRTESGDVTITNDENVIDIKMIPEFGYLNVATIPENSANVYLNNELVGKTPYKSDKLSVGSYTVKVEKDQFKTTEETIVVKGKETTNVNIKMLSIYTDVIIKTDGESDIFIDGKQKGKGLWSGKLMEGTYIFESRKENHRTTQKTVVIAAGNNQTIILDSPESINGSLDVSTIPSEADIYIDEKRYGKTPDIINEILIGDHELKLVKQGYTDLKKKITIKEGEMLTINEKLDEIPLNLSAEEYYKMGKDSDQNKDFQKAEIYYLKASQMGHAGAQNDLGCLYYNGKLGRKDYEKAIQYFLKSYEQGNVYAMHNLGICYQYGNGVRQDLKIAKEYYKKAADKGYKKSKDILDKWEKEISGEINGHEYVGLGLPSGRLWATCNVGAKNPEDYGNYYAWGETRTKKRYRKGNSVTHKESFDDIGNNKMYDAARKNWGKSWRLPTEEDFDELIQYCTWKWTSFNGINGYEIIGRNGNSIFLPAAGYCRGVWSGKPRKDNEIGNYSCSTPYFNSDGCKFLYIDSDDKCAYYYGDRFEGISVRPVVVDLNNDEDKKIKSQNQTFTVNGVSFTMIKVEGGTFKMGAQSEDANADNYDKDAYNDEKPVHSVTLSDYYIGETEVTQELWNVVMGTDDEYSEGGNKPVIYKTWEECKQFIEKLNELTGKNFRFPTEAEWEYAARGGKKSKGYKYSGSNNIEDVAWYGNKYYISDVKKKEPNELGIYDMSGNVWEWCQDKYGRYNNSSQTNPKGVTSGNYHVYRGGSWFFDARICRVSNRRADFEKNELVDHTGLRLAL